GAAIQQCFKHASVVRYRRLHKDSRSVRHFRAQGAALLTQRSNSGTAPQPYRIEERHLMAINERRRDLSLNSSENSNRTYPEKDVSQGRLSQNQPHDTEHWS